MPAGSKGDPWQLTTPPGTSASTRIEAGRPAIRLAISKTEIAPAASSSWKSGKTRTPIMFEPSLFKGSMSENEGNMPFAT